MTRLMPYAAYAAALSACVPTPHVATFARDSVYMVRDHYRVFYAADAQELLGPEWALGTHAEGTTAPPWRPEHTRVVRLDDAESAVTDRYDLRLTHRSDRTLMFAQTTPIPRDVSQRSIAQVTHELAGRIVAAHSFEVDWDAPPGPGHATLREDGPVTVDGVVGHWMTFDVPAESENTVQRMSVVALRPSARWRQADRSANAESPAMLVVFGCVSSPRAHDLHRAEFEGLLSRVDFRETQSP